MTDLIREDESYDVASILLPEIAAQYPDALPMTATAALLLEASKAGNRDLARRAAQLAAMFWSFGDEDVRADVIVGFFHGLKAALGHEEPNGILLEALTEDQRKHLKETPPSPR